MSFKKLSFKQLILELDKYKFKQLHIHHTWKPNHSNFRGDNYISIQQGMKNYHMNTNKWSDIGQHLSLFPDGVWLTGRPFNKTPASIKGWNTGALCVEMIGDFDIGRDKLEGSQLEQILLLVKYFIDKYGEQSIKFHNENSNKSCPGSSLNKQNMILEAKELNKPSVSEQKVSDWAKSGEKFVLDNKISDGTRPKNLVTREEVWTMLERYNKKFK